MTYDEVTEVKQIRGAGYVNELLDEGWTLIHINVDEDGGVTYIVGKSE